MTIVKKTISTHNGSVAKRGHNIRDPKAIMYQNNIDTSLSYQNEYLIDEPPREAYERIFGEALNDYNEKQKRSERKIKNYFNHVSADQKKHAVYEMVVQVGDKHNTGLNAPVERAIIKEFIATWSERNPNLELIGAYIHADEPDGTLHAHLDYIPVAHGYKNGLRVQNGLNKALLQQGFSDSKNFKTDKLVTPQIHWEARENKALEEICNRHGIEVEHPDLKRKHLDTPEYKEYAVKLEALNFQVEYMKGELGELYGKQNNAVKTLFEVEELIDGKKSEINALTAEYALKNATLEAEYASKETSLSEIKKTLEEANENLSAKRAEIIDLNKKKHELSKISEDVEVKKEKLGQLDEVLAGKKFERDELDGNITKLKEILEQTNNDLSKTRAEIIVVGEEKKKEIKRVTEEFEEMNKKSERLKEEFEEMNKKSERLKEEIELSKDIKKALDEKISGMNDTFCKKGIEVVKLEEKIEEKEKELNAKDRKLNTINVKIEMVKEKLDSLVSQIPIVSKRVMSGEPMSVAEWEKALDEIGKGKVDLIEKNRELEKRLDNVSESIMKNKSISPQEQQNLLKVAGTYKKQIIKDLLRGR